MPSLEIARIEENPMVPSIEALYAYQLPILCLRFLRPRKLVSIGSKGKPCIVERETATRASAGMVRSPDGVFIEIG